MRHFEVRNEVLLLPVLEVEPYHFSSLPLPEVAGSRQHPAQWGDYFRHCMADAGFTGVEPIAEGSSFVSARSLIGNALLDQLIREAVEGSDLAIDRIPALSGGLALIMSLAQLRAAFVLARHELRRFRAELVPVVARILGSSRHAKGVTNALLGSA